MLADKLSTYGLFRTPEGVALWIALLEKHPSKNLPHNNWHQGSPLGRQGKTLLAQIMRQASLPKLGQDEQQDNAQTGHWNIKIHFAWRVVLSSLISASSVSLKEHDDPLYSLTLEEFWSECVDSRLIAESFLTD